MANRTAHAPQICSDRKNSAFSLVEVLIAIGIVGLLLTLLPPALHESRMRANNVQCQSNLRQVGIVLQLYMNDSGGWLFPVGARGPDGKPGMLGTNLPPHQRWPVYAGLDVELPEPLPYARDSYKPDTFDPVRFPVEPFTPKVLVCPTDLEPLEAHSYVLNAHLSDKGIRATSKDFGGLLSSQVIVAGEKRNTAHDYFMARNDFHRVVDPYKHGARLGSNYLFFDGHVDNTPPNEELAGMDPWDLRIPDLPSTRPTTEQ